MSGALRWAVALRRQRRAATLLLVVFAGLGSGVVMSAVDVSRRTSSALDRYLDQPTRLSRIVNVCPVGVTGKEPDFDPSVLCNDSDDLNLAARLIGKSPLVRLGAPVATIITGLRVNSSDQWDPTIQIAQLTDGELDSPIVVDGELPARSGADEIALNEPAARRYGLHVGDTVTMGMYLADQRLDIAQGAAASPDGARLTVRVAAIIRSLDDLEPDPEEEVFTNGAWWRAHGSDELAGYGKAVGVQLRDQSDRDRFDASLPQLLPGRLYNVDDAYATPASARRVIQLQSSASWAVALAALIALLAFVGQALRREGAQNLSDRRIVESLGMTRRDIAAAAWGRSLPVAAGAALTATAAMVALSPIGPVGQARAVEVSPGLHLDWFVAALGSVAVGAFVSLMFVSAAIVGRRSGRVGGGRMGTRRRPVPLSVPARAGLSLVHGDGRGAVVGAVLATSSAIATLIFAVGISASHHSLIDHPQRYGQTWDVLTGNFADNDEVAAAQESMTHVDGVEYGITRETSAGSLDGRPLFVMTFARAEGRVRPVVVEGRVPADGEAALGRRTMNDFGIGLGDTIRIALSGDSGELVLRVVGRAVINDGGGSQARPDEGALVTASDFDRIDRGSIGQYLLVRDGSGRSRADLRRILTARFGRSVDDAVPPQDVGNLDRVAAAPGLLAALVAVLALTALVGSLTGLLGRRRRDIGILRSLGFTRAQLLGSALAIAATIVVWSTLLGVPLGIVAARRGWATVQARIGVTSTTSIPPWWCLVSVGATLALAAAAAMIPGVRAARQRTDSILRAE